jgi:membrane-associated phospholipid phosphatase
MEYHWYLVLALLLLSGVMILIERSGLPVVLDLRFKGDIKRENRWFAQYGQAACTFVAGVIVWRLDERGWRVAIPLMVAPLITGLTGVCVKRFIGRVRPGHPGAGTFLGYSRQHANWRESFPSNHTAAAASLTVGLSYLYPQLAPIVWPLAVFCGLLRYLMDAHWPSDVLAGLAYGASVTPLVWLVLRWIRILLIG